MQKRNNHFTLKGCSEHLKTLFQIIYYFFLMYLSLLILSIPILLLLCYRFILSLVLSTFYKGKYKLMECTNACFGLDQYANVLSLYFFMYINGPCDIEFLRQRIYGIFTGFKDKNGTRPYEVMLCALVRKFGFFCWENKRDSFDIKHHIRSFPGCDDPNRIYTEGEIFDAVGKLADDLWPESLPKWEILVVPQLRKDDTGEVCSAIHLRLHHAYVDGISAAQMIRLCFGDQPPPKFLFDPVNPPISPVPLWMKLVTYLQVIFLGPWASLQLVSDKKKHVFYEGPLTGGKYFGRTKLTVPMKRIRKVREVYGCSTSSVLHFAMTGALEKLALRKGFAVPDEILGSLIIALLPYPNEYPQNNATIMASCFQTGIHPPQERLMEVNRICKRTNHPLNYYTILASKLIFRIVGIIPAALIEKSMGSITLTYCLSNVPGTSETMYFNGNNVVDAFGTGSLINGCRYFVGVACYKDKFTFTFQTEKSSLIKSREELNELIGEFEHELNLLMESVPSVPC